MSAVYVVKEGGLVLGYYSSKAKAEQALLDFARGFQLSPVSKTMILLRKSAPCEELLEVFNTEYAGHFFSLSKVKVA